MFCLAAQSGITEKSTFQITVGIPTKRNERSIAFHTKPKGYSRKAIGLSFLSVGILTESLKTDFSFNSTILSCLYF